MPTTKDKFISMKRMDWVENRERLLGIEWGLLQTWEPVCNEFGKPMNPDNPQGLQVAVNTGMMGVIPVEKLAQLLDTGPIAEFRAEQETIAMEGMRKKAPISRKTSASDAMPKVASPASDENPDHKTDFDRLLTKAAKVTKDQ